MGWIKTAHGIRGEVFIQLNAQRADWLEQADRLYLLRREADRTQEFLVKAARPHKEGLIVVLDGIINRNQSEELKGTQIYIPEEWLTSAEGETIFLHQIENFDLVGEDGEHLGRITGFATNGSQDLLRVRTEKGNEALIPFVEDFLLNIDFAGRKVQMKLPPGLLTIEES